MKANWRGLLAVILLLATAAVFAVSTPVLKYDRYRLNCLALYVNGTQVTAATAAAMSAGTNGTAGTFSVWPTTTNHGKTTITATDNTGNTTTSIVTAAQGGARTYTVPDAGGNASFWMSAGNNSSSGTAQWNGSVSGGIKVAPIATGTAVATLQNQNVSASVVTLPSATCTLPGLGLNNAWTGTNTFTLPTGMEGLLSSTASVDVGATGETTLYTVPTGKSCIITRIVVRNASGTFDQVTDPQLSFGWNAGTDNDVIANATYTNAMSAATKYFILVPDGKTNSTVSTGGTTGGIFAIKVNTAATASTTCTISVFGYLF